MGKKERDYLVEHTPNYVHLQMVKPCRILSSAVLNGGFTEAEHILNLKVPLKADYCVSPEETLRIFTENLNYRGTTVGLMTAASMETFTLQKKNFAGSEIAVLITAGVSNARRAGDEADYIDRPGTINIIVYFSGSLTPAAMTEAIMIITEAKCAALQELKTVSTLSGKTATGTGTDSTVVISGNGEDKIEYCGKHTLPGEIIGKLVIDTLKLSIGKIDNAKSRDIKK